MILFALCGIIFLSVVFWKGAVKNMKETKKQKKKGIEGGLDLKKLWKIQCAEAFIDKSLGCELLGVEPDDIFAAIGESVKLCMDILENKTAEVVEMKGE